MANPNEVWGRRLKEARERLNISQRELGISAGIDPGVASTRINRYELGIHKADFPTSQRLAAVLGIPVAYLYSDDEGLAELILLFGQMTEGQRVRLLSKLNRSLDPEG